MVKKKSTIYRELLEASSKEIVVEMMVPVALYAQMAEKAGFKIVSLSGNKSTAYLLGLPDLGLRTLTECVDSVRWVCNAVDIPVTVDCDTGFGNALNVRRTVESVIRAGAAGLFIEDQVAPKRCGFVKGKEIISIEEAVGKYRAAVDVRNEIDPDFVIMARCDARGVAGGSIEEVIRRSRAYREAGVDIFYAEALQSREEIKQVRAGVDGLLYVTTHAIEPSLTLQELQDLGICMTTARCLEAGLIAMWDMLVAIKQRGLEPWIEFAKENKDHPFAGLGGVFDLVGTDKVAELEEKYLPAELQRKYDQTLGLYDPRHRGET